MSKMYLIPGWVCVCVCLIVCDLEVTIVQNEYDSGVVKESDVHTGD